MCAVAVAAIVAGASRADVGVYSVTPEAARPGTPMTVRVGGFYGEFRAPLYVVPASRMPQWTVCGPKRVCAPSVGVAPTRWPYTRVGTITTANKGVIRFRLPRVPAGRYGFAVYCDACTRGAGGTLIPSTRWLRVLR